jgi:hypothetical protein
LYRVIITAQQGDPKAFVVASSGITSVLYFVKIGLAVQKLWKKYADGAIVSLAFFFFAWKESLLQSVVK